ncbi:helix-hairpin-helix domain-containing protein [Staphylococcus auricularis]|uniref:helix-hairpin-helix domain-containing protein n=1 Tax=Staphylococcus auricularis TaxID=29379 RepID=UPI003EBEDBA4
MTNWETIQQWLNKWKLFILIGLGFVILFLGLTWTHQEDEDPPFESTSLLQAESGAKQKASPTQMQIKSEGYAKQTNKIEDIYVDIKGAVEHPNIYQMKSSDRVKQLLDKAKVAKDADLSSINLSEKLVDQKLIYIPKKGEVAQATNTATAPASVGGTAPSTTQTGTSDKPQVNLNQATETDLQTIPGIGPSKAKAIIEFRETQGSFTSIDQLKEVKGIGDKTFENLAPYLTV